MTPERAGELAVRAAGAVVVASVALALAGLTWRLTGWDDGRAAIVTAETLPPRVAGPDPDVVRIVGLAPFGGGPGATGLPASTLGLVLKGVLLAWPPEASLALIATGEGPAQSYGVGASPAGNAVIEAIEIDRVILKVGDRRELLGFPEPALAAPPATTPGAGITIAPVTPPPSPEAAAALATASPIASAAAAAAAAQARPAPPPTVDPAAAVAAMGATPVAEGYRIGANPPAELRRFGLRPGDVIETLNGESVGDLANDRALVQRAVASGGARVEIVRDGRRLTLTFPLR